MISIKNLTKKYGDKIVFDNFNLEIEKNKTTVILGESGSGKTTLLNVLSSQTDYNGEVVGIENPASMVFQTDRLVPNLTVYENLKLVCKNADIDSALKSVNLFDAKDLYPKSLSAGMKRRVSILRALLFNAKTLFMDEPFINLDIALKFSIIEKIKESQKSTPKTVIIVTHDIKEAVSIADRIIVIKDGKVIFDEKSVNENTEDIIFDVLMGKVN